ncbi:MAG: secretin N-terminal domain-containing protein [Lacunisphaera sp.]
MSTRIILTALLTSALTLPIIAQTDAAPAAQPQPAAAPASEPVPAAAPTAKPAASATTRDKDTLSVDFPDEDIKTILRNVADLFELNLVVPDTVTGKTTIKMHDVTWRQIFHSILAPINFTYVEDGNIIKIVSNETLQQEPVATEVFILNNAKASDIKPTIDGLVESANGGKIVIDGRSNALVITERPSRMGRIRSIIEQLDKATDQVMIESKFVEVTDRDIRNIGVNWASLQGQTLSVGKISQTWGHTGGQTSSNTSTNNNGAGNATTYVTNPNDLNSGNGGFNFNTPIALPSGSATNLPATVPGNTGVANWVQAVPGILPTPAIGIPGTPGYVAATQGTLGTPATFTSLNTFTGNNAVTDLMSLANTGGTSRLASAVFSASDFNVIVSALKTQNNTKIVSNPTVVTLNNTEAVLNVGQEFPIPCYTYNTERGTFEVSGFTYKPIGIILKVTPQVNSQGIIKLSLEPEVSQRNGDTTFNGATIPIIATRKAKTQVSLKDGYTMGIGGLISASTNHGGTKVPVLGDIPILGRLFSSKSVDDETTNLLIFITAKTITSDGAAPEEVFDPRMIKAIGMTHEDLPGNRAPKGTDLFAPAPAPEKQQ